MNPLLLTVEIVVNLINFSEGTILNLGSLFVSSTVLDVVEIVIVRLHAHLAVGVLLIGNWLEEFCVVPGLHIVVSLSGPHQVLVVFTRSLPLN